jgi:hypothetical protein
VVEAYEPDNVNFRPIEEVLSERLITHEGVDWYQLNGGVSGERASRFWLSKLGERYASPFQFFWSFSNAGAVLRKFTRMSAATNLKRWFCSHLIAAGLLAAGYQPNSEDPKEAALVSPENLSRFTCIRNMGPIEGFGV